MTGQREDKQRQQTESVVTTTITTTAEDEVETAGGPRTFTDEHIDALSRKVGGGDKVKRPADKFPDPISVPYAKLTPMYVQNDGDNNGRSETNNVWTVRGSFTVIPYIFSTSLTMTIVRDLRDNESLTVFNAFRCSPEIEQEILKLGTVRHVVKLGQFHGDADAYYVTSPQFAAARTGTEDTGTKDSDDDIVGGNPTTQNTSSNRPKLWTFKGGSVAEGLVADEILSDTNVPIAGSKAYDMTGHPFPEGVMTVPYSSTTTAAAGGGGVEDVRRISSNNNSNSKNLLIACDSLVHIVDLSLMTYTSRLIMWLMGLDMQSKNGIPKPAPLWCKTTVDIMGVETVKKWYQDIMDMDWDCFVGAHGTLTKTDPEDRRTIMDGICTQLESNVRRKEERVNDEQ